VTDVGLDFCRVVSIVESSSSVGVYVDRSQVQGVVKGDVALREDGVCLMSYSADADIKTGDLVYTSGGSGSSYPAGLLVGEIISITADDTTRTLVAEVIFQNPCLPTLRPYLAAIANLRRCPGATVPPTLFAG
jgi:rod shape-determining protein MreC